MHRMRVILSAILVFVSSAALAQDQTARVRAFEQFVEETMKAQKMPGLSVAVMHGDFRWSRGFGLADVENEVPARADSSYRMGSVAKPMTAVAVLRLADEGKIDLDAEVQTYVPYFPRKPFPVTVRQLLSHQGGISHYRDYSKEGRIREPKTTREAIAIFESFDLVAEPGTSYNYTTYGYNLLGAVVESVSGKSYGQYLTENVWKPLGMNATRMDDPRALVPHRVTGYTLDEGVLRRSEYVDISSRFGGGGTRSTVEDMIRFVEGLAAGKVLKNETREAAWTPTPTRDRRYTNYGLGFGVESRNGRWVVAHTGSQQETRTSLFLIPSARFAVALASNFEDADLDVFEDKLIELFLGDPRPIGALSSDDATNATWRAMNDAFLHGLAYYERHGRPMTTNARELTGAFAYFRRAQTDAKLAESGAHPVSGEALTKLGSYMASVLATKGSLDVYHREGPLRFFADYNASSPRRSFGSAFATKVRTWLDDWSRVWTPELQKADLSTEAGMAVLERNRPLLEAAALKPDFSRTMVRLAEQAVQRGDFVAATHLATSAHALYPRSAATNGILGIFAVIGGDIAKGKTLLSTSVALDPRDYARAQNLLNIANFFSRTNKPAAVALLQIGTELHPASEPLRARLEELKR